MPFSMTRRRPQPLAGLAPPSQLRDSSWPQLAFDPVDASAGWVPFFLRHAPLPNHGLHMGVSENSVPLNPMVNDHYPY